MVPDEMRVPPSPEQLISSFQVLHLVADALSQITTGEDSASVTPTIARIHAKIAQCEAALDALPGGSMTRADQLAEIDRLRTALLRKRDLVRRYARHDLVARVLAQRALPTGRESTVPDPGASDAPDATAADGDTAGPEDTAAAEQAGSDGEADGMRIEDNFDDVSGVPALGDGIAKDSADDVLMGLGI